MAGDFMWSTCQVLLGWIIDTVNMTLSLPPHWENRFKEILAGMPCSQKRIGVNKWYRVLGKLCYMDITLPGTMGLLHVSEEAHGAG